MKFSKSGLGTRLFFISIVIIFCAPLYFIVVTAFKSRPELTLNPIGLPKGFEWENWMYTFTESNLVQAYLNSLVITISTIVIGLIAYIFVSFYLCKMSKSKLGYLTLGFIISGMMIAPIGFYQTIILYRNLGLYNSTLGVILALVAGMFPFSIFFIVGAIKQIPKDLMDASTIDGCNDPQQLVYIVIPTVRPIIIAIGIFLMVESWNNFIWPLILIRDSAKKTLPLQLAASFVGDYSTNFPAFFAAVIITSIPIIIIYLKFQKYFIHGLTGGIKG